MESHLLSNLVVTSIVGSMKLHTKSNASVAMNNRTSWGIAIKTSGFTQYYCQNKAFNSDSQHIVLLPQGSSYQWQSTGGECLLLNFEANIPYDCVLSFSIKDNSEIVTIFNKIEKLRILKSPYYKMKCIQLVYKILIIIFEQQKQSYTPSEKRKLLKPAIDYIVENYDDSSITAEMLSQMTHISYTYFRKLFLEIYGHPPMEYLHRLRLKKAKEMLSGDYSSIEEIAKGVGYSSIYHFSKMFKKHYGASPTKYISQAIKELAVDKT